MKNLSRNNHYIPKFYLKNWGTDSKIWEMKLLVPNKSIPVWRKESIKRTAVHKNLYIRTTGQSETDEFEMWFNTVFETPVQDAFYKAVNEDRLTPQDWEKLINFLAAMSMRTPAQIVRMNNKLKEIAPRVLEKFTTEFNAKDEKVLIKEIIEFTENKKEDDKLFPIILNRLKNPNENEDGLVEIRMSVGKGLNFYSMNQILTDTAKVLHDHHWSIFTIADGMTWVTSDDPVMCINTYGKDDYDFKGGWGKKGCEIIFPISPTKALYAQVGFKHPRRKKLSEETSEYIQRLIIFHAHRSIYSLLPEEKIEVLRPRVVDYEEYKSEQETWDQFHKNHIEVEKEYYYEPK